MMARYIFKRKNFIVYTLIISLLVGIIMMLPYGNLRAEDNKNHLIPLYEIVYSDDKSKANIQFDMMSVDTEKYEIIRLSSSNEELILYDVNEGIENNNYEVERNGIYDFKISYLEKSSPSDEASTIDTPVDSAKSEPMALEEGVEVNEDENIKSASNNDDVSDEYNEITSETLEQEISFQVEVTDINVSNSLEDGTESENSIDNDSIKEEKITPKEEIQIFADPNSSINLADAFYIYGKESYNGVDSIKVTGNSAILTTSDIKGNIPMQTSCLTSKKAISFNKSFSLEVDYSQPTAPDGVSISFHNVDRYDGSTQFGGFLGVYGAPGSTSWGTGLSKGLVLELDGYGNTEDLPLADKGYGKYYSGAHMAVNKVLNGSASELSSGVTTFKTSDLFDGNAGTLNVNWNIDTLTISISYKGKSSKYQFTDIEELKSILGSDDLHVYYSICAAINYGEASAGIGDTALSYRSFNYTNIDPELLDTSYSIITDGNETALGKPNDTGIYAKSGDTILVKHKLKNNRSFGEINDVLILKHALSSDGTSQLVEGSVKQYTDPTNKKSLSDDIVGNGIEVTYPANNAEFYIEYQLKVPDYLDAATVVQLKTEQWLGEIGMEQKDYSQSLNVISRGTLLSNDKIIDNQHYLLNSTKTTLTDEEVNTLLFENLKLKRQDKPYAEFSQLAPLVYSQFITQATATATGLQTSLSIFGETYNGVTGEATVPTSIDPSSLGMYYSIMKIYDTRFDAGYSTRNANGENTTLRRIWIGDNFANNNDLYAISKNVEIDEVTLSKMNDEELKEKLLNYIMIFSEKATIDSHSNLNGDLKAHKESITTSNIEILNFMTTSQAKDDAYKAKIKVTANGREIEVPVDITVIQSEPAAYISIPKAIELKNDEGIDNSFIGRQMQVKLIDSQKTTSKQFLIKAETGYKLNTLSHSDTYTVDLYNTSKNKLTSANGIAEVGTLSSIQNDLTVWLNAKKETNSKGNYSGIMKFYIEIN